jgi:hypothetical protein
MQLKSIARSNAKFLIRLSEHENFLWFKERASIVGSALDIALRTPQYVLSLLSGPVLSIYRRYITVSYQFNLDVVNFALH